MSFCPFPSTIEIATANFPPTRRRGYSVHASVRGMVRFHKALLDSARKISLRKIKEVIESARIRQGTIYLLLAADMIKHLRNRNKAMRSFFPGTEHRAHRFQKHLQLAEEQIVLVAKM